MNRADRGSYYIEGGGVRYCNRCNHIVEFPDYEILSNAFTVSKAKKHNFRTIERFSEDRGDTWCGRRVMHRKDMDSCMNCNNARGYDCDEHWTENRCMVVGGAPVAPFTICDLHGKEVKWDMKKRAYVVVRDKQRF
jgi:hypothetical protein